MTHCLDCSHYRVKDESDPNARYGKCCYPAAILKMPVWLAVELPVVSRTVDRFRPYIACGCWEPMTD